MMLIRLTLGLGLFLGSMILGWWLNRRGRLSEAQASTLLRVMTMTASPFTLCLSFWQMNLRSAEPWLLPLLGFLISAAALIPATLYARHDRLSGSQTGSFLTCAFFSNLGYLGAFSAFALFGEAGYALCMAYVVYFTPSFYTLGFGIASRYGHPKTSSTLSAAYSQELRFYPFVGMLAGAVLSLARVPRPPIFEWLNSAVIPLSTALSLMAIGSQLTFESPRPWLRPCLAMSAIKFVATPLIAWALLSLFHIQGLTRSVVLIEAATPVGVSPLLLPLLFGLDRKLANALWLFTTVLAVPTFALFLPLLAKI